MHDVAVVVVCGDPFAGMRQGEPKVLREMEKRTSTTTAAAAKPFVLISHSAPLLCKMFDITCSIVESALFSLENGVRHVYCRTHLFALPDQRKREGEYATIKAAAAGTTFYAGHAESFPPS